MAQFDVHRNRGLSRDRFPFVVIVQSALYDEYNRRVVVPLSKKTYFEKVGASRLNPTFIIDAMPVVLHPLEIASLPADKLGKLVQSLAEEADRIIGALDELLTRAWG